MKKNVLGAAIFLSLLALAVLSVYIYAARTGSGQRLKEFQRTTGYLEDRIAALERQRDLLGETVTALEEQADAIRFQSGELTRRVEQIDAEISNMRDLIGGAKKSVRTPLFSLRTFRLTAGSGVVIIAFLAFIWLLYTSLRSRTKEGAFDAGTGGAGEEQTVEPVPGSVLEEEFPAASPEDEPGAEAAGKTDAVQPGEKPPGGAAAGEGEPESPPAAGSEEEPPSAGGQASAEDEAGGKEEK